MALQSRENQTPFYLSQTEQRWVTGLNFLAKQGGGAFRIHTGNAIYELYHQPTLTELAQGAWRHYFEMRNK